MTRPTNDALAACVSRPVGRTVAAAWRGKPSSVTGRIANPAYAIRACREHQIKAGAGQAAHVVRFPGLRTMPRCPTTNIEPKRQAARRLSSWLLVGAGMTCAVLQHTAASTSRLSYDASSA